MSMNKTKDKKPISLDKKRAEIEKKKAQAEENETIKRICKAAKHLPF